MYKLTHFISYLVHIEISQTSNNSKRKKYASNDKRTICRILFQNGVKMATSSRSKKLNLSTHYVAIA